MKACVTNTDLVRYYWCHKGNNVSSQVINTLLSLEPKSALHVRRFNIVSLGYVTLCNFKYLPLIALIALMTVMQLWWENLELKAQSCTPSSPQECFT